MQDSFDAFEYAAYLRQRWVFLCTACGVAVVLAFTVSMLLPKQYTATASIVIDAPGGNDVRTATAVSPVYLESLKSYEYLASSDTLFQKALDHLHIRESGETSSIESLKRRILTVNKLRDTRILEISVRRPDPKQAQAFVQFLAEETVKLSQSLNTAGDSDLLADAERRQESAYEQLRKEQAMASELAAREPLESLQSEIEALVSLKAKLREQLLEAQVAADSQKTVSFLEQQGKDLDRQIEQKSAQLAQRSAKREALQNQLWSTRTTVDAAGARLRDLRNASGSRGERLRIIDPGIVPQRPSSPNIPLNVFAALLFGAVAAVLYLSLAFQNRPSTTRQPLRFAAKKADG